jgi:hypothetical protein
MSDRGSPQNIYFQQKSDITNTADTCELSDYQMKGRISVQRLGLL